MAVYDLYAAHLEGTAGMFAPEAQEQASALFGQMIGVDDNDDDDDGAENRDEAGATEDEGDAKDIVPPASTGAQCGQLQQALIDLKSAISG